MEPLAAQFEDYVFNIYVLAHVDTVCGLESAYTMTGSRDPPSYLGHGGVKLF